MKFFLILLASAFSFNAYSFENTIVKTDNPRDTIKSFYLAMDDYHNGVLSNNDQLKSRILDATRCFNPAEQGLISDTHELKMAAILLKETIDRSIKIDFSLVPVSTQLSRWRLKNTEIVLRPIKSGPREGEWLISQDSWKRASIFYKKVAHLSYIEDISNPGAGYSAPVLETYLPEWTKLEFFNAKGWQWIGIFVSFLIGLLVYSFAKFALSKTKKASSSERFLWKRKLILNIEKPASLLITVLFWMSCIYFIKLEGSPYKVINAIVQVGFGISITWMIYQTVEVFSDFLTKYTKKTESTLDDQLVPFTEKTLKMLILSLGTLLVLQNLGFNVFSLLAGLGLGGLAFALAAKDTAANFFGSIMIIIDQPFKIGDWVVVDKTEGVVEEVGFRSTRIRTFYNSLVTIPNSTMASRNVDNMGERQLRRVKTHLDLSYDTNPTKMEAFLNAVRSVLLETPEVEQKTSLVYFSEYSSSSLKVLLYFFLKAKSYEHELETRQTIFYKIYTIAQELDVEFAFPTQTIELKKLNNAPTTPC